MDRWGFGVNIVKEKYIKIKNLSISDKLLNFVNNELLPGTEIKLNKKLI